MMKNFLQRLWTSFIVLGIFGVLFLVSGISPLFELAVAILICLCIYEALTCAGCATKKKLLLPCVIYGAAVPLSYVVRTFLFPDRNPYFGVIIISFIYLISLFIILMVNFEKTKFSEATVAMFITFVITCFLTNIIFIRRMQHGLLFMVLCIVCSAWCTDVFAYLTGILIGKHRPFPSISPKKSIEGCIGGSVFSVAAFIGVTALYHHFNPDLTVNWGLALLYSFCCTVIGQIGDLSFSYIKRSYGVKDFGKVLPGHGGFLDRLDSLIFIAPTFYALLNAQSFIG